uniref:Multidrug resistance-associated protein 1 n=1 Tax=Lygus hesperus TaxID=30085 RepID=A0A0A9WH16_LYGHE
MWTLITSFSRDDPQETVVAAVQLIMVNLGTSLLSNHYLYATAVFGMKMRAAIVSVVFRKSLRLSKTALNDVSPGQIVNLVSNDVSRFEIVAVAFSFLWSGPLQTVIIAYFLYRDVGLYSFAGMAVVVGITILQTYTARLTSQFRRKIAREADTRIRLTDEILAGILVLKLYAWEKPFTKLLEQARRAELKYVQRSNYIRTLYMAFNLSTTKWALFLTLSTYILSGFKLTTAQVFVISSYYSILNHSISSVFVRGIQEVAECTVSLRRLQGFLLRDEIDIITSYSPATTAKEESTGEEPSEDTPLKEGESLTKEDQTEFNGGNKPANGDVHEDLPGKYERPQSGVNSDLAIDVQDVKACWVEGRMVPTLMNLTFTVRRRNLIGLIGSVGSGKSSLLHLLLSELKQDVGKVIVNGSISYASQESWIFAGTVRDNILLGRPYNRARYRKVIAASCLTRDLELFPHGDRTTVGERGASLSGGQRARISLARAIYREADIYLLDDPLSAVDAHVAKEMFQNCFKGFLKNKTVILATHQLQFLDQVDKVIFLQVGQIKDMGTFEELMSRGHDFTKIIEESQVMAPIQSSDVSPTVENRMSRQISESEKVSAMGSAVSIRSAEGKGEESQPLQDSNAPYEGNIFIDYLRAGRSMLTFSLFCITLILAQFFCSLSDYWVSDWAKTFDVREADTVVDNSTFSFGGKVNGTGALQQESLKGNTEVNGTDVVTSIKSNLTSVNINQTNTLSSLHGLTSLFGNDWTDEFYVTVYGIFVGMMFIVALVRGVLFVLSSLKCSRGLHSKMVKSALYTDLSFFNNNPSGSILNKFSKDLGVTDEMLPKAILDSSQTMGLVIGGIVNTLIVNYMLLIPLGFFILASILIRKYYMNTATNLKRIENMSRSPIYTHLNTSLQGLTTIRAQSAQHYLKMAFDLHQDLNTTCLFTYVSAQQAYSYCLDICSIVFISIVLFTCIIFRGGISGADLGLAVTQSMMMTGMLQWSTRQSSEVVNMMTSVERLVTFTKLPPEDPNEAEKKNPPSDWPSDGAIKLENVSLRYKPDGPPALDRVNLVIRPGEKLGIVGRTGAGKVNPNIRPFPARSCRRKMHHR